MTTRPDPATPTPDTRDSGAPKVAAEGVPSVVRPNPHARPDSRHIVAMLHIAAPRGTTPTATSRCVCGRDRSAIGHRRVAVLIEDHAAHRDVCPLRTTDGKAAA
ncbi:hypothetical protein GCM10010387_43640 [Streptomyces inusitatus]|uniref:Uncharacterized protein n=1 Tax=Streptomyces inusitatus TaxID=68221 RepID=A0A918UZC0_9ACTN|nr:hypothetical protein GCM10010387_43640 [Streptomyces inusitatus]